MNDDDEAFDRPEDVADAADAMTAALAASSPHHPSPELRDRVLQIAMQGRLMTAVWRYAAVAAIVAGVTGIVTWNVAAANMSTTQQVNADVAQLEATNEVVFDVIACRGGHIHVLRAIRQGSMSYGKLYTCPTSDDVVFMSGKLSAPPPGQAYELWLTKDGVMRPHGTLRVWPSLTGSGFYFGSITFKAGLEDPSYEAAELTLQAPKRATTEDVILRWNAP